MNLVHLRQKCRHFNSAVVVVVLLVTGVEENNEIEVDLVSHMLIISKPN